MKKEKAPRERGIRSKKAPKTVSRRSFRSNGAQRMAAECIWPILVGLNDDHFWSLGAVWAYSFETTDAPDYIAGYLQ